MPIMQPHLNSLRPCRLTAMSLLRCGATYAASYPLKIGTNDAVITSVAWGIRDKDTTTLTPSSRITSRAVHWTTQIGRSSGSGTASAQTQKGGAVGVELEVEVHCDGGLISW